MNPEIMRLRVIGTSTHLSLLRDLYYEMQAMSPGERGNVSLGFIILECKQTAPEEINV